MKRAFFAGFVLVVLAFVAPAGRCTTAQAEDWWSWQLPATDCPSRYYNGDPPIVISEHDFGDLEEFCYRHFVVLHSTTTRGAIWSAMFLDRRTALLGDCLKRQSFGFHVQAGVPREDRASASDYAGHGADYEIGHMTPANDMPTIPTQRETFVFSNAVPQASELNAPTWATLELQIHDLAEDVPAGLYVVTGPIYANHTMDRLNGRVGIPTHVFKAVYDPAAHRAIVFLARNRHTATVEQISLTTLQDAYGIVAFPRLSASVRSDGDPWALPEALNRRCAR